MNLKLEISIALRYLRAKRKEGFASVVAVFSFIGIMLGVATLVVTMAVMHGVKKELITRIIGINSHISIGQIKGKIENYEDILEKVRNISGVKFANAAVYGQTLALIGDKKAGVMLRGIAPEDFKRKEVLSESVKYGKMYSDADFDAIVGVQLSAQNAIRIGDRVKLISPSFSKTLFGAIPRYKEFGVAGVFDVGMYEYDNGVIFTSLETAKKFFNLGNAVNTIEIQVDNPDDLAKIKDAIYQFLPQDHYITDWREANEGFLESIDVQANVLFLILTLIILVAAFNVISGMVMLVNDKNKEIAILRTMGMSGGSVLRIFVISGFLIGLLGTILGLALGVSFASNIEEIRQWLEGLSGANLFSAEIYFLSKLPADLRADDIIMTSVVALSLSLISTIYPAWKASKIEPAEALKYE